MSLTVKVRSAVAVLAIGGLAASAAALAPSASADTTPASQARGQFLTGTIGGKDLSQVAAVQGVTAANTGGPATTKANTLNASALNNTVKLPLTGALQLPGGNVVSLGAANQVAEASPDGSAHAASGAVSNSGGISIGGVSGAPADASINLAGLGGGQLANTLGNLALKVGAVSARADQGAGTNGAQTGDYQIADLGLDLTSPALASVTGPLVSTLSQTIAGLATQLNNSGAGLVTVTGVDSIPDAAKALTSLNVGDGAITASLTDGSVHVDLAKLLAQLGLDLNNLPPNTHLIPYLTNALATKLPSAVSTLLGSLQKQYTDALGKLGLSIAGVPLNTSQLGMVTGTLDTITGQLDNALSQASSQFTNSAFVPLANALGSNLDVIANGQSRNGTTFTQQAVQLDLGRGTTGAQLVLASASVSPGTTTTATEPPSSNPTGNPSTPDNPVANDVPRSTIKIDAGKAAVQSGPNPWLAGAAVALMAGCGAGLLALRRGASGRV